MQQVEGRAVIARRVALVEEWALELPQDLLRAKDFGLQLLPGAG